MLSKRIQILVWSALLIFWVLFSIPYHPSLTVDIIVTLLLLSSYAGAIYLNALVLIPAFFHSGRYLKYSLGLTSSLFVLTFLALAAVRLTYQVTGHGNELGDYWQNYWMDLTGMGVHLAAAMLLLWLVSSIKTAKVRLK